MPQPRTYASDAARQAAYRSRCKAARLSELARKGLPPMPALPTMPGTARWKAALKQAELLTGAVCQEMQDYYDERSEEWQEGDRAEEFQDTQQQAQEIADLLATLADEL
jgi:hypothetical protein